MPTAPTGPCGTPGCPEVRPCPTHPPAKPWAASKARRQATGAITGGRALTNRNRKILKRHRYICHVCGEDFADQVDHVVPLAEGGTDDDSNLRPIHSTPCHAAKSKAERIRGQRRHRE